MELPNVEVIKNYLTTLGFEEVGIEDDFDDDGVLGIKICRDGDDVLEMVIRTTTRVHFEATGVILVPANWDESDVDMALDDAIANAFDQLDGELETYSTRAFEG